MNEKFTIDDMIEFCNSELDYRKKESNRIYKEHFNGGKVTDAPSFALGINVGANAVYQEIIDQLIKLKEMQNERED